MSEESVCKFCKDLCGGYSEETCASCADLIVLAAEREGWKIVDGVVMMKPCLTPMTNDYSAGSPPIKYHGASCGCIDGLIPAGTADGKDQP